MNFSIDRDIYYEPRHLAKDSDRATDYLYGQVVKEFCSMHDLPAGFKPKFPIESLSHKRPGEELNEEDIRVHNELVRSETDSQRSLDYARSVPPTFPTYLTMQQALAAQRSYGNKGKKRPHQPTFWWLFYVCFLTYMSLIYV